MLWTADVPADQVLLETSEVVVVSSYQNVRALDARTGQALWQQASESGRYTPLMFTDGTALLALSIRMDDSTSRLTAHDLMTGEELWVLKDLSSSDTFAALGGTLLLIGEGSVARWG